MPADRPTAPLPAPFPPVEYMAWAKHHQDMDPPAYDLSVSGMPAPDPVKDLGLGAAEWDLGHDNLYGLPALRDAIRARWGSDDNRVLPTCGSSMGNFLAAAAVRDICGRSKAVIERPVYEPITRVLEILGLDAVPLERREEDGWHLDVQRATELLSDDVALVFITTGHNPTGVATPAEDLAALQEACDRVGATLIVDEVYRDFEGLEDGRPAPRSAAATAPGAVTTSSLTKVYGLGPLRAGWILGPAEIVERAGVIHDGLGAVHVGPAERAALRAVERLDALRERTRGLLEGKRQLVADWVAGRDDVTWTDPGLGNLALLRLPDGVDSRTLETHLRERHDAQISPGHFFGLPGHARVCWGMDRATLEEGLTRLGRALDDLSS